MVRVRARQKRPSDVRGALEQYSLDHGRVFIVLRAEPSPFTEAVTIRIPRLVG